MAIWFVDSKFPGGRGFGRYHVTARGKKRVFKGWLAMRRAGKWVGRMLSSEAATSQNLAVYLRMVVMHSV